MKKEKDLKSQTMDELKKLETEYRTTLTKLGFKHRMGQLEKTGELRVLRKNVARVQTFIRQKELAKVKNAN